MELLDVIISCITSFFQDNNDKLHEWILLLLFTFTADDNAEMQIKSRNILDNIMQRELTVNNHILDMFKIIMERINQLMCSPNTGLVMIFRLP